ncbi:MAG: NAD(P)/FAD-dependent oxidoreductase [Acidimicrobiales bacterium]
MQPLTPTRNLYDVAVIGSGPSGAVCAGVLAERGYKVALIDRSAFPRDKACGDVIGPRALALLRRIGAPLPQGASIGSMDLWFPNGRVMTLPSEPGLEEGGVGIAMQRYGFDESLHRWAIRRGAKEIIARLTSIEELPEGALRLELESGTNTRRIVAQVLVGADGANSSVARALGLANQTSMLRAFAIRQYVEGELARPVISLLERGRSLFPGYGWVFPVKPGVLNVGIGISAPHGSRRAPGATDALGPYLDEVFAQGIAQGTARSVSPPLGGWLSMGMAGISPGKRRVLLIGDAAGLINPLQGEGIAQAVESAIGAADAIQIAIDDPLPHYTRYLNETHRVYQCGAATLQRIVLSQPQLAGVALKLLSTPRLARAIAPTWGIYWNDLAQTTGPLRGAKFARTIERVAASLGSIRSH